MKYALLGLLTGAGVAGFFAYRESVKLRAQGADLANTLKTQGQQVAATLTAGGTTFRHELEALARAQATADAMARSAQMMRIYGLTPGVLAKLEAFRDSVT